MSEGKEMDFVVDCVEGVGGMLDGLLGEGCCVEYLSAAFDI